MNAAASDIVIEVNFWWKTPCVLPGSNNCWMST